MAIKLIILGLRRSGTTIFWEIFRQDRRLVCYDEPFNELLQTLPAGAGLKHPQEFARLVEREPQRFWERYTPIPLSQELKEGLGDEHRRYLDYLAASGSHVVADVTRCHYKIAALRESAPDAVLVHLYRRPASHATSHMLPGAPGSWARLRRAVRRVDFWTRRDKFNSWGIESIVGTSTSSLFAQRLREAGLDAEKVYPLPAVGKLLAFWRIHYERAERDGRAHFGERFVSQSFEAFCADPAGAVRHIYAKMGLSDPGPDFSRVHAPNRPYDEASPNWERYLGEVGLTIGAGGEPCSDAEAMTS